LLDRCMLITCTHTKCSAFSLLQTTQPDILDARSAVHVGWQMHCATLYAGSHHDNHE